MHAHGTSEPPRRSFELFSLIRSLDTWEKRSQAPSPLPLLRKLWREMRLPLRLLFYRVHNPKSLGNLIGHSFQPCPQLCCPPLNAFRNLHILQTSCSPELHAVLKVKQLNTVGQSLLLCDWPCCVWCTARCSLPSWLPGHTAGMFWACCQPAPPDPFLQGCSPATPLAIYTCAQCYSIPGVDSGI